VATPDTPDSDFPGQDFLQSGDSVDFDLSAFSPAAAADAQEPTEFTDEATPEPGAMLPLATDLFG